MRLGMRLGILYGFSLLISVPLFSQDLSETLEPVHFRIETRIVTPEQVVDWSNLVDQIVADGKPVVVHIDGDNFRLRVTFTSFYQNGDSALLVAQTEVVHGSAEKRGGSKSLLSQVVRLGVPLLYYPLGKERKSEEGHTMVMEILLTEDENR